MQRLPRVAFLTNMPSYHQVELFDALSWSQHVDAKVFYLRRMSYGRHWEQPASLNHKHLFISEVRVRRHLYLSPGAYPAIQEFRPDLLVVCQYASPATQLAMWLHSLRQRPWVFWSESPGVQFAEDPIVTNEKLRTSFRSIALAPVRNFSSAVWGIGERATAQYAGLVRQEIVCLNVPYYSSLSKFERKRKCSEGHASLRFLFSGSLSERKGFDILVDAVEQLVALGNTDFEVVVMGKGPQEELLAQMTDRARSHVCFLGFQQFDALPEIYASCDVLVFPSRYDGWGMVIPEAMASGMPVIASINAGATYDLVRNGLNGFTINVRDSEDLTDRMQTLIDNPGKVIEMGRRAQVDVQTVDIGAGVKRIEELVRFVLAG